jgi:hypothetical protein
VGDEVDVVTRTRRQRGQKQRGVHRPIQSGPATGITCGRVDPNAPGRRAAGVEDDDHPTVALGPPCPHHHVCAPGGGAPVDGSDVVADDVFAQRIEFSAMTADQHRRHAFEFAQLRQPRRQMLARQERRQDPDLPRHPMRALPPGQTQRADRACGDKRGALITAANRPQLCEEANLLGCSKIDGMLTWLGAGAGRPCVSDLSPEAPLPCWILDHQHRVDGLAQPCGRLAEPAAVQPARTGRQPHVHDDRRDQGRQQEDESDCGPG